MGDALPFVSLGTDQTASVIVASQFHTCALLTGGVKCWGWVIFIFWIHALTCRFRDNVYGQLGQGNTADYGTSPSQMGDALPFVSLGIGQTASMITVGEFHTCALLTGGVKCWGWVIFIFWIHRLTCRFRYNVYSQLGLGNANNYGTSSGQMGDALPFVSLGIGQTASMIAAGYLHTCALLTGGIKCWGWVIFHFTMDSPPLKEKQ